MAAADPSTAAARSQRDPGTAGDRNNGKSPQFGRSSNLHSPWAQVVRGDSDSVPPVPHSPSKSPGPFPLEQAQISDCSSPAAENPAAGASPEVSDGSSPNASRPKKPAWNKPSNGVADASPVMDAHSWPALSESTRVSPRSPSDSSKNIPDASSPTSEGPLVSVSNQKFDAGSSNSTSPNHNAPVRQKSMKRGGPSGNGSSRSSVAQPSMPQSPPPPPAPPYPLFRVPQNSYGHLVPVAPDLSSRPTHRGTIRDNRSKAGLGPQSPVANGHHMQRNASRRGNFRKTYGGRRDQESVNNEWNFPIGSTARDVHIQPQIVPPRAYMSPPPNAAAFMTPQPGRAFGNPMGIPDMASPLYIVPPLHPEAYRGFSFIGHAPPPPAMYIPVQEPPLAALLVHQIDYYFSDANLVKDEFLKSHMDDNGWVPVTLIANFPRVKSLTHNIQLILDSLRNSVVVEVQGDKLRKRNDWMKWIATSGISPSDSGLRSPGASNNDSLTSSFQKVTLGEVTLDQQRGE